MDNPYTSAYAPAMLGQQNPQGLAQQQAFQRQQMQQSQQLAQPQQMPQMSSGINPMSLAKALRGDQNTMGVTPMQNAQAYMNSKFGRDQMQPNTPDVQQMVNQYAGAPVSDIWSI